MNDVITLPYFVSMSEDGRIILTLDNHLLQTYGSCPAKFHLRHIRRLKPKGMGGVALNIGAWWSAVMEDLYTHMKTGFKPGLNDFIGQAGKRWQEMGMDGLEKEKPKQFKEFGGPGGAVKMAHEYYTTQASLDLGNWQIVGAELGFGRKGEVLLYEEGVCQIYWMGKPDLTVFEHGELLPVETKTVHRIQRNTHLQYKPHSQITGYVYSINKIARNIGYDRPVNRCIVSVGGRMPPAANPRDGIKRKRFIRVFPNYSEAELFEWRENTIAKAKRLLFSLQNDTWNWEEGSCHLYGGCEYRGVHSVAPGTREAALKSDFVQIEPWTPYKTEEEEEDE